MKKKLLDSSSLELLIKIERQFFASDFIMSIIHKIFDFNSLIYFYLFIVSLNSLLLRLRKKLTY